MRGGLGVSASVHSIGTQGLSLQCPLFPATQVAGDENPVNQGTGEARYDVAEKSSVIKRMVVASAVNVNVPA